MYKYYVIQGYEQCSVILRKINPNDNPVEIWNFTCWQIGPSGYYTGSEFIEIQLPDLVNLRKNQNGDTYSTTFINELKKDFYKDILEESDGI